MDVAFNWVGAFADNIPSLSVLLFILAFANVFLPPVPIETIGVFAGYLSVAGHGNALVMWLSLSVGMAVGSTVLYLLAYSQGSRLLRLPFVRRQMTSARLNRAGLWFHRYGVWAIYAGKLIPGMSFATVVSSGLFRVEKRRALTAIYVANFIYFAGAVILGRVLGEEWQEVSHWGKRFSPWLLAVALAIAIASVLMLVRKRTVRGKDSP